MVGQAQGLGAVADRQHHWIERLPAWLRPYAVLARWDRPIGAWLLYWPCAWGLALAPGWPDPRMIVLFGIGAIAMRGAGCTINDLVDRDYDRLVERTRARPLASGALGPREAALFLAVQLLVGLAVLLCLPRPAQMVALASVPLVVAYPFMKRVTWWPQAFLGITFNWGVLVGAATVGAPWLPTLVLYLGGVCWTLGYDTIYAHQDKEDDALIGVKSSARRLGERTPAFLWLIYGATLLLWLAAALLAGKGWPVWLGMGLTGLLLVRQILTLRLDDAAVCLRIFRANHVVGLVVFATLAVAGLR